MHEPKLAFRAGNLGLALTGSLPAMPVATYPTGMVAYTPASWPSMQALLAIRLFREAA